MDVAISYGQKTRDAIAICCALLGMGVEIGKHEEFFKTSDVQISSLNGQNYVQPKELHGLIVYPQDSKVEYVGINFSVKSGLSGEKFQETFVKSFELSDSLDNRLGLAFELYNSHHFETSIRARFLQLVSAIECLATRQRQQNAIIEHLKSLVELSKKKLATLEDIPNDVRDDFVQCLNNLKRESISRACRNLVRKYLGEAAVSRFKEYYNTRSKLIHDGKISPKIDLRDHYLGLNSMLRKLLYAIVSNETTL